MININAQRGIRTATYNESHGVRWIDLEFEGGVIGIFAPRAYDADTNPNAYARSLAYFEAIKTAIEAINALYPDVASSIDNPTTDED